jgi:hypothetical protein
MPLTVRRGLPPGPIGLTGNWVRRSYLTTAESTKNSASRPSRVTSPCTAGFLAPHFPAPTCREFGCRNRSFEPRSTGHDPRAWTPNRQMACRSRVNGKSAPPKQGTVLRAMLAENAGKKRRSILRFQRSSTTDRAAKSRETAPVSRLCFAGKKVSQTGWRSGRDSNPRYAFGVYSLSRRAPSTTRPPLRIPGSPPA